MGCVISAPQPKVVVHEVISPQSGPQPSLHYVLLAEGQQYTAICCVAAYSASGGTPDAPQHITTTVGCGDMLHFWWYTRSAVYAALA